MRVGFVVALLGALAIAAVGMIKLGGPNPEMAAPIPHAAPAPHAAAARPGPLLTDLDPAPTEPVKGGRLETLRMLKAHAWDELTQRIEAGQRRIEESGRFEPDLMWAVSAFDVGDPAITPLLDSWVAAKGTSYAPYLAQAITLDPRHIDSYRDIDYLLAKRGDWGRIVERWSRYIELEPMSGQAYLERGGALHHKGEEQAALADLRKACGLGEREACALAQRVGG